MQPGSSYPNRRNNTYATSGESIDIDQRSIAFGDLHPDESYENGLHREQQSPPPQSSYLPAYPVNSDPMGQGPSTPRDESNTTGFGNRERGASEGAQQHGAAAVDPERAAAAARLRRSRRIRNHIEHFARLGARLVPGSASSSSAAAAAATASPPSNPSTGRTRLAGLRFRARGIRVSTGGLTHVGRARSPSPPRRGELSAAQARRRTMPPLRTTASAARRHPHVELGDMMDISPVPTVTPQNRNSVVDAGVSAAPLRRSRMSRVRDSFSLMSSELNSMLSRPNTRRQSETRAAALDALNGTRREPAGTDAAPAREGDSIFSPTAEEPSRPGRASIFGSGARDPQGILDGLSNPGRIRPGEDQAAMLSRLLSVAAAATAASLVGDAQEAITQAQDVGGDNGGDGSFESFLRALRNGRLEAALRNGGNEMGGGNAADPNAENGVLSLNFFRMFRFGSTPAHSGGEDGEEGNRMVPVIIVGIRSVSPRDSTDGDGPRPAPFFDALANLSIPSVHRRSRMGSVGAGGGVGGGSSSGARPRPASMGSPISPSRRNSSPLEYVSGSDFNLSPFAAVEPNRAGPWRAVNPAQRGEGSGLRRDSLRRRGLTPSGFLDLANPNRPQQAMPAAASESGAATRERSNTTGAPNRPGVPEGTRSWIIYVLGGSYPENHPILTTPSLFTDVSVCYRSPSHFFSFVLARDDVVADWATGTHLRRYDLAVFAARPG